MAELEKEGKLAHGLITADFETKVTESEELKKIMKREDATEMIGIAYHDSATTNKANVTLLKLEDQMEQNTTKDYSENPHQTDK